MAENDSKDCPYCAEPIRREATICRYCRSPLSGSSAPAVPDTYRNRPGRQIAGVSIAMAEAFDLPVTLVRLAFILLTFVSFAGPVIYAALWVLIPDQPGGLSPIGQLVAGENGAPSILERFLHWARETFDRLAAWFRGKTNTTTPGEPETPPLPTEEAR